MHKNWRIDTEILACYKKWPFTLLVKEDQRTKAFELLREKAMSFCA